MNIIILITCADKKQARKIAKALVEKKEAACVNIIGGIESIFRWQNKLEMVKEVLLVVKSKREKIASIIKLVKSMHSYSVPEIIALNITAGEKSYLKWLDESVG